MPRKKCQSVEARKAAKRNQKQECREDADKRDNEQEINSNRRKLARLNPEYRITEQEKDTSARRVKRLDADRRVTERAQDAAARSESRLDLERRDAERGRDAAARSESRLDLERRDAERGRDAAARSESRLNEQTRGAAQEINTIARRQIRNQVRLNWEVCLRDFKLAVSQGPTYICSCCGGLWFITSIRKISEEILVKKGFNDADIQKIIHILNLETSEYLLCNTCWSYVSKKRVPVMSLSNGLDFPVIPDVLKDLSPLEERLVSPRLPFMQIKPLGYDRQYGLKGNIVNVFNPVDNACSILPRSFNEMSTVQLHLMRRMEYRQPYMCETIRPAKVIEAARYLVTTPAYQDENITLSDAWSGRYIGDLVNFVVDDDQFTNNENINDENDSEDEDQENQVNPHPIETLITDAEGVQTNLAIRYAPGEGRFPMSLVMDNNAEILSFPKIYCGEKRNLPESMSRMAIATSEIRRYDRRCCTPTKLLYTYKLMQNQQLVSIISLCLRKKKGQRSATAGQLINEDFMENLVQHDDGFRMFRGIRGSPGYWEEKQKKLLAMIRQFGLPSVFVTLSPAEIKWPELLLILKRVLDNVELSESDVEDLNQNDRTDLLRRDPVTCARYFDWRLRQMIKFVIRCKGGCFGEHTVQDFFYRIEFQHRGSPHMHGLFWLKDAPKFIDSDPSSHQLCSDFIDKFVTCESDSNLDTFQHHRHTACCKRMNKGVKQCRFGIPYPPMEKTIILLPLPVDVSIPLKKSAQLNYLKIKEKLEQMGRDWTEKIAVPDFISSVGLTPESYLLAIRSSIRRPTTFLKRDTDACYISGYNRKISESWKANMDMQFILDPYACAKYCVAYITKSYGGLSLLLRKVADECRKGNVSVKEKLRKFANTFLNGTEISAQEAAYYLLRLPLSMCSRDSIFINTGKPDERVFLIKSAAELRGLDPSSEDVVVLGLFDHYCKRPLSLENICLAEFAAMYTYSKKAGAKVYPPEDELSEHNEEEDVAVGNYIKLLDGSGFIRRRLYHKIIRYRRYNRLVDPVNYFREELTLYFPWRDEILEIVEQQHESLYISNLETIKQNKKAFDASISEDDLYQAIAEVEEEDIELDEPFGEPLPEFDIDINEAYDIVADVEGVQQNPIQAVRSRVSISKDEYYTMMRSLNRKQKLYTLHILHSIKLKNSIIREFLFGMAGVGKSHATKAIINSVLYYLNNLPGANPASTKILVCGSTGKAAFNVGGQTLHGTFVLPLNQYRGELRNLSDDTCNRLACEYKDVQLIIIDEISMVSRDHLYHTNMRLKQIFKTNENFGGKAVLVVGDLRQLPPVAAGWIFSDDRSDIGAIIGNPLWEEFKMFQLDEIMRQKDDADFAQALNRLGCGECTANDIIMWGSRETTKLEIGPSESAIYLARSNEIVTQHNTRMFNQKCCEDGIIAESYHSVEGRGRKADKEAILNSAKDLIGRDAQGLPQQVPLRVTMRYMVTVNVDVLDGIFNGATGRIKKISYGTVGQTRVPMIAWIDFGDTEIGRTLRLASAGLSRAQGVGPEWTPISMVRKMIKAWPGKSLNVVRKQFPLTPAEAITIHKSQGDSYDEVVVELTPGMTRALLYVAFSRCRSLNGLFLNGVFKPPSKPFYTDSVETALRRLNERPVILSFPIFEDFPSVTLRFGCLNIQSLHLHFEDIKTDPQYLFSDILFFVETWSIRQDKFELPDMKIVGRLDSSSDIRKPFGIVAFGKVGLQIKLVESIRKPFRNSECGLIALEARDTLFIGVYKPPSVPLDLILSDIRRIVKETSSQKFVLLGDWNIDLNIDPAVLFYTLMNDIGVHSTMPKTCSSTNGGTQLDICFSNIVNINTWFYETYFSYHKAVLGVTF